jgi:hypothetical protein
MARRMLARGMVQRMGPVLSWPNSESQLEGFSVVSMTVAALQEWAVKSSFAVDLLDAILMPNLIVEKRASRYCHYAHQQSSANSHCLWI